MSLALAPKPLRVLQVLPALNSGGVERGTLDLARELVAAGHESIVLSNGGGLVAQLEAEGSQHIGMPVHKKSLWSLRLILPLRKLITTLQPDVIHVRSRLPAWLIWLAWRKLPVTTRPRLVSTFHGLYSINRYSQIMGCGERVIAISGVVRRYITDNYPSINPATIRLVHRGVDTEAFQPHHPPQAWLDQVYDEYPQLLNQRLILMPGRLSRWKGQLDFLEMMAILKKRGVFCHGVILGGAEPNKEDFEKELMARVTELALEDDVTLVGHRTDIQHFYVISSLVCNLSVKPEPFGRTVIEALACGRPVLAKAEGGPEEVLQACYPEGLTSSHAPAQWAGLAETLMDRPGQPSLRPEFTLNYQLAQTLAIYQELVSARANSI